MPKKSKGSSPGAGTQQTGAPFNNPFQGLADLQASLPPGQAGANAETPQSTQTPAAEAVGLAGKLVLRRERKGHGGKSVTLVQGLALQPPALAELARAVARDLGVGARVKDGTLIVAGEQQERLAQWLRSQGASHIVLGN